MNKNSLLEHLKDAHIGVAGSASKHFPPNITRVLSEKGAQIVSFTVGHETDGPFVTIPQQDVVIAPFDMELPGTMTGQILRWRLGNEQDNGESIDIDDVSPNQVAKKVAELINESKFKLPEWFEGYNFRYEGSVVEHPITKESCRTIRLFKTFEEGNIRETYAQVYLDEQGQLFTVSMEKQALPPGAGRFTVAKKEPSKKILTADSEIEVKYIYQERPVGETHHETEHVSFFKTTES